MPKFFTTFAVLLAVGFPARAFGDCTVVGSISIRDGETAEVRIYAENNRGGNGPLKYSGKLRRGQKKRISGTDRIRYEYKYSLDSDFHSITGAWCKNGEEVKVP